ncbi:MAG: hypothetical protein OXU32_12875 [Gammaproteobacteria bacterium]|nr:hypothetical protein [Gammaproteobacteria bacterium]
MRYGAGILFPRQSSIQEQDDTEVAEGESAKQEDQEYLGGDSRRPSSARELRSEADTEQEINRANEYLPSGLGLTAVVRLPPKLVVEIQAGRYEPEILRGQKGRRDKDGNERPYQAWRRIPICQTVSFTRDQLLSKKIHEENVETGSAVVKMKLHVFVRDPGIHRTPPDSHMITFTLINATTAYGTRRNDTCLFQCSFSVSGEGDTCFLEYPDRVDSTPTDPSSSRTPHAADLERHTMRLLYRGRRVFAVGHGCAPEWNETNSDATDRIRTEVMPGFEIKPIYPTELSSVDLNMERLAEDERLSIRSGERLAKLYAAWIDDLEHAVDQDDSIPPDLLPAARTNISRANACLRRMLTGIQYLRKSRNVRRAFAIMNRAMLMQQLHYRLSTSPRGWKQRGRNLKLTQPYEPPEYKDTTNKWRPFQFAFVLLNIASFLDPSDDHRAVVDVIWFPTGGGKTEAYLGLSAFAILWRRLQRPKTSGTAVLMRYTLRLLTTQQYQRASSLICALEYLRRQQPHYLGATPVTIGLWVGGSVTPNNDAQAKAALSRMERKGNNENRFVLVACPWCGAGMGAYRFNKVFRVVGYQKVPSLQRVGHVCADPDCDFHNAPGLPVLVTDDAIYKTPPTLLIGTVDKFALLPWYPDASAIFGLRNGHRENPPPDLIVQDELHLISGPLGSMVGHYETVIGELCTSNAGRTPKIVASTATIARAPDQVRSLYARESFLFPPQGLEWGNSFFAEERRDLYGRYYLGVFATGLSSQQTAMVRVMSALLQAPRLSRPASIPAVDPYWTLITYFNSIRELGSAATLVSADIREYMRVLHRRMGLTRQWNAKGTDDDRRRWITSPTLELTSRVPSGEISSTLQRLFDSYTGNPGSAVDICLATNMIQVGLDVGRLGLMMVAGQPKTTAEYIQATSRVGRRRGQPGLVVVLLNPSKPRDRSHYEHFRAYHEQLDSAVEPTSVTPFAVPVRDRALHALIVTLIRYWGDNNLRRRPDAPLQEDLVDRVRSVIRKRIEEVDPEELDAALDDFSYIIGRWHATQPGRYGRFGPQDEETPLMYPFGTEPLPGWDAAACEPPWPTASSMRSVDADCELGVIGYYYD